ncbi:hypothetical protein AAVH_02520 [Aphelenchoides avenae]|nr:hypothetical protein AAVH_02520 [Aphelenchus avenae]
MRRKEENNDAGRRQRSTVRKGEIWNKMSAAEKRPYIEQAAHLKEQYLLANPDARSRHVNRNYYTGSIPAVGNEGLKPVVMSPTFADDRRMSAEPIFASGSFRHTSATYLHRVQQPEQRFFLDPETAKMVRDYLTGFVISDDEFDKYLRGEVSDGLMQPPPQSFSYAPPSNAQRQRPQPSILQPRQKTMSSVTYIKMEPED